MNEFCVHERWIVEVAPGEWAHEDDLMSCIPAAPLPIVYLDEVA